MRWLLFRFERAELRSRRTTHVVALLGRLLANRRAHVNLIPLNPTPGSPWDASPLPAQREFVARLRAHGVPTTVRDTRGQDIDGACGQLAAGSADVDASVTAPPARARA